MREAMLYQKLEGKKVQCNVCNHYCKILAWKRGICGSRENYNGKLMTLNYGKSIAMSIDPIEKKPFLYFLPGTFSYSFAAEGCNFRCDWCQNSEISQRIKPNHEIEGAEISPEKHILAAIENDCPSISYTYTEPTIFLEYALETMKLAHQKKLKNIWVSNGYMSSEALELILPYLDAVNIDLKSFDEQTYFKYCGALLQPILDNLIAIYKAKVHLEITTLIIPNLNDSKQELKKIADFIATKLSKDVPWHLSRFSPTYKMTDRQPTPIESLELAQKIGQESGLTRINLGNI